MLESDVITKRIFFIIEQVVAMDYNIKRFWTGYHCAGNASSYKACFFQHGKYLPAVM